VRGKKKIQEALFVLRALGLPREQQNERSALTLLALLDLRPATAWKDAQSPPRGITEMMNYFAKHYGKRYAPNSRETVRRFTVHQFVQAGLLIENPDEPTRPTNSPKAVYQVEPSALSLLQTFGSPQRDRNLLEYLATVETLRKRYAQFREVRRIPLELPTGGRISLSPGGQNELIRRVVEDFCACFTPKARPLYVGDAQKKWAHFDKNGLLKLGVEVDEHGKMPDVVVYDQRRKWLVLIEAVTSHGPMNPKRRTELKVLFSGATVGIVFVTAFLTRRAMVKYLSEIAWETEVWVADAPTHLIHFNGERFFGPYPSGDEE
jgi:hypothetical protein